MRATLTGDFAALNRFGVKVGQLGSTGAMTALSKALGDEALFLVQQGFAQERDPYGRPWFPKRFPNGQKILRNRGKLISSFKRLYAGPDASIIASTVFYSGFVQSGTGIYGPSRQPIRAKAGKALRFRGTGVRTKAAGGSQFIFRRQVDGSPARMMVPSRAMPSLLWNRALKARAAAFFAERLRKVA